MMDKTRTSRSVDRVGRGCRQFAEQLISSQVVARLQPEAWMLPNLGIEVGIK